MRISPFVRCPAPCGKIHVVSVMSFRNVTCPHCGVNLWDLVMGVKR